MTTIQEYFISHAERALGRDSTAVRAAREPTTFRYERPGFRQPYRAISGEAEPEERKEALEIITRIEAEGLPGVPEKIQWDVMVVTDCSFLTGRPIGYKKPADIAGNDAVKDYARRLRMFIEGRTDIESFIANGKHLVPGLEPQQKVYVPKEVPHNA